MSELVELHNRDPDTGTYNLCYINTFIQCLFSSEHFTQFVVKNKSKLIFNIFYKILEGKIKSGNELRKIIHEKFKEYAPGAFGVYGQLFEQIFYNYTNQYNFEFNELFRFITITESKCDNCGYFSQMINYSYQIKINTKTQNIFGTYNNETCTWDSTVKYDNTGNILYDASDKFDFPASTSGIHSDKKCSGISTTYIVKAPKILIVNISNGLNSTETTAMLNRKLKLDETIRIKKMSGIYHIYQMVAIAINLGNNIHYVCKIKKNDNYFLFDDTIGWTYIPKTQFIAEQVDGNYTHFVYYSLLI